MSYSKKCTFGVCKCGLLRPGLDSTLLTLLQESSTNQCSLSVCKKADNPSIHSRITMVATAQNANRLKMIIQPQYALIFKPSRRTMFHNTSDNSATITHILRPLEGDRVNIPHHEKTQLNARSHKHSHEYANI